MLCPKEHPAGVVANKAKAAGDHCVHCPTLAVGRCHFASKAVGFSTHVLRVGESPSSEYW
jgi:hypothetical protein